MKKMPKVFLFKVQALKNVTTDDLRLKGKTIVIDSGYGGGDRGTKGKKYGTIEKDLSLKVAQNIKKENGCESHFDT